MNSALVREFTLGAAQNPTYFSAASGALCGLSKRIYPLWTLCRAYDTGKLYMNPKYTVALGAGRLVRAFADTAFIGPAIRFQAWMINLIVCLVDCRTQFLHLSRAFQEFKEAAKGVYPMPTKVNWLKADGNLVSPSTSYRWISSAHKTSAYTKNLAAKICTLAVETAKLSVCYMYAFEAFSLEMSDERVDRIFYHVIRCTEELEYNKASIYKAIRENPKVYDQFSRQYAALGFGQAKGPEDFIRQLDRTITSITQVAKKSQDVSENVVNRHAAASMSIFGILGKFPTLPSLLSRAQVVN